MLVFFIKASPKKKNDLYFCYKIGRQDSLLGIGFFT